MSTLMTPTDYVALPTTTADARMRYGDGDQQFGDIYEPPDGTADAIPLLLLHGGCWQHAFGLLPMGQMARAIADMGFLVCNLEYRRLGGGGGLIVVWQVHGSGFPTEVDESEKRMAARTTSESDRFALDQAGLPPVTR